MQIIIDGRDLHSIDPLLRIDGSKPFPDLEHELRASLAMVGRSVESWECHPPVPTTASDVRLLRIRTIDGVDRTESLRLSLVDMLADHWMNHAAIAARLRTRNEVDPTALAELIDDWRLAIEGVTALTRLDPTPHMTGSVEEVVEILRELADSIDGESDRKPDYLYTTLGRLASIADGWLSMLDTTIDANGPSVP